MIIQALLLITTTVEDDARAALALAAAQSQQAPKTIEAKSGFLPYKEGLEECRKTDRPLVVFVGIKARKLEGVIVSQTPFLWRTEIEKIDDAIFVTIDGKFGHWYKSNATDQSILKVVNELKGVRQQAESPFQQGDSDPSNPPRPHAKRIADDSNSATGPWYPKSEQERIRKLWPKVIPFPDGLKFYKPTRYSQATSVTNERFAFRAAHISEGGNNPNLQFPYAVPGGLDGIPKSRWNSYAGVKLGKVRAFDEIVYNSLAAVALREPYGRSGLLRKRTAELASGSFVVDLLTNDRDEVFELRMIDFNGKTDPMVAYKDRSKAPQGYAGAGKACIDCHSEAGSTNYGAGVRGIARNVFSLPLFREGTVEWDVDNFPFEFVSESHQADKPQRSNNQLFDEFDSFPGFQGGRRRGFRR